MITQKRLHELLDYDPSTGIFRWRVGRGYQNRSAAKPGDIAGCTHKTKGYVVITLDYVCYRAHKLAWIYVYGTIPSQLDHKNGNRADNRIENLRPATPRQNNANRRPLAHKLKGAFKEIGRRWRARIRFNGNNLHLGMFDTEQEANDAYDAAARKIHGEFARST